MATERVVTILYKAIANFSQLTAAEAEQARSQNEQIRRQERLLEQQRRQTAGQERVNALRSEAKRLARVAELNEQNRAQREDASYRARARQQDEELRRLRSRNAIVRELANQSGNDRAIEISARLEASEFRRELAELKQGGRDREITFEAVLDETDLNKKKEKLQRLTMKVEADLNETSLRRQIKEATGDTYGLRVEVANEAALKAQLRRLATEEGRIRVTERERGTDRERAPKGIAPFLTSVAASFPVLGTFFKLGQSVTSAIYGMGEALTTISTQGFSAFIKGSSTAANNTSELGAATAEATATGFLPLIASLVVGTGLFLAFAPIILTVIGVVIALVAAIVQAAASLVAMVGPVVAIIALVGGGLLFAFKDAIEAIGQFNKAQEQVARYGDKNETAMEKFQRQLRGLSPAAREFVDFVTKEILPAFDQLKAIASESFLPGITKAFKILFQQTGPVEAALSTIGRLLGEAAERLATLFSGSDFLGILDAAVDAFDPLLDAVQQFGEAIFTIFGQAGGVTGTFADYIKEIATRFNNFIQEASQTGKLQLFFQGGVEALEKLLGLVGAVGRAILSMLDPSFNGTGNGAASDVLTGISDVFDQLTKQVESGDLQKFFADTKNSVDKTIPVLEKFIDLLGKAVGLVDGSTIGQGLASFVYGSESEIGNLDSFQGKTDNLHGYIDAQGNHYDSLAAFAEHNRSIQRAKERALGTTKETATALADSAAAARESEKQEKAAARAAEEHSNAVIKAKSAYSAYREAQDNYNTLESTYGNDRAKLDKPVTQAQRSVRDANENVGDTRKSNVERIKSDNKAIVDSIDAYNRALRATKDAEKELSKARRDALKDLNELRKAVERQNLAEEKAVLTHRQAQQAYFDTLNDQTASYEDKEAARIKVQETNNDVIDVRGENAQRSADLADALRKGIEGSDGVISAVQRLKDAEKSQGDAYKAIADARKKLTEDQIHNERDLRNALEGQKDAEDGLTQAVIDRTTAVDQLNTKLAEAKHAADAAYAAYAKAQEAADKSAPKAPKPEKKEPVKKGDFVSGSAGTLASQSLRSGFEYGPDGKVHPEGTTYSTNKKGVVVAKEKTVAQTVKEATGVTKDEMKEEGFKIGGAAGVGIVNGIKNSIGTIFDTLAQYIYDPKSKDSMITKLNESLGTGGGQATVFFKIAGAMMTGFNNGIVNSIDTIMGSIDRFLTGIGSESIKALFSREYGIGKSGFSTYFFNVSGALWTGFDKGISNSIATITNTLKTLTDAVNNGVFEGLKPVGGYFSAMMDEANYNIAVGTNTILGTFSSFFGKVSGITSQFGITIDTKGLAPGPVPALRLNAKAKGGAAGAPTQGDYQRFDSGGKVQGSGGGTEDKVTVNVSPREWILPEHSTNYYGDNVMEAMRTRRIPREAFRNYAVGGKPRKPTEDELYGNNDRAKAAAKNGWDRFASGGSPHLRFAVGGTPSATSDRSFGGESVASITNWLETTVKPLPYVLGAIGKTARQFAYDCSSLVYDVWARLTGNPSAASIGSHPFVTANEDKWLKGHGFKSGYDKGGFSVGLNDHHTVGRIGNLEFSAANSRVGMHIGSGDKVTNYPRIYYLPGVTGSTGGIVGPGADSPATGGFDQSSIAQAVADVKKLGAPNFSGSKAPGFLNNVMDVVSGKLIGSIIQKVQTASAADSLSGETISQLTASDISALIGNTDRQNELAGQGVNKNMLFAYAQAKRMGVSAKHLLALFETGLVESRFQNYANSRVPSSLKIPHQAVGSDHTSVGILQQQVGVDGKGAGWGTVAEAMDPAHAAAAFLQRAKEKDSSSIKTAGALAQKVQVSAYPERYQQRRSDALALLRKLEPGFNSDFASGGSPHIDPYFMDFGLAAGGIASPQAMVPSRQLSAAASTINNNSTSGPGFNVENLTVNNPVPERGGDSIFRRVQTLKSLYDR